MKPDWSDRTSYVIAPDGTVVHAYSKLDPSQHVEETLGAVAQIAIPEVADWCAVSVLDDAGLLQDVAAAHVDDAQRELGRELSRRFPPDPSTGSGT